MRISRIATNGSISLGLQALNVVSSLNPLNLVSGGDVPSQAHIPNMGRVPCLMSQAQIQESIPELAITCVPRAYNKCLFWPPRFVTHIWVERTPVDICDGPEVFVENVLDRGLASLVEIPDQ